MRLMKMRACDVLVVGSGIAGISAALKAASLGRSVILTSSAHIFSGSSFYPGTWGLGLIGPADESDQADLIDTIQAVGCGMADPALVKTFVEGIHPAIEGVRRMGVRLRIASQGEENEYIPCFDHKHRDWNGIEFEGARDVFSKQLKDLEVQTFPHHELMELVVVGGRVCGAVFAGEKEPVYLSCGALILATGGCGGLFQYHLCTEDITGLGQALALKAGCHLVNMEFMQMMPGYISPAPKTIYNEKVFRFTQFYSADGNELFPDTPKWRELLALRSTHGPFTSRLASREIDLALFQSFLSDEKGITASYMEKLRTDPPEFVKTYFDWLAEAKGLTVNDSIQLGIFAHAANGGIQIGRDASTGVPGLFACGEVTGGMHGADRIGGLSTANGLVFGGIAGSSAAYAAGKDCAPENWEFDCWAYSDPASALLKLRRLLFQNAMVLRSQSRLSFALEQLVSLSKALTKKASQDIKAVAASRRLEGQFLTAESILRAAMLRCESRGSHYREDYPITDPAQDKSILISYTARTLSAHFKEE